MRRSWLNRIRQTTGSWNVIAQCSNALPGVVEPLYSHGARSCPGLDRGHPFCTRSADDVSRDHVTTIVGPARIVWGWAQTGGTNSKQM
ncbi:Hypp7524 [Branchiostoma lanceolatum]|uniref:Hypp7524 protein n=1 Tax=Branchiostoma lanceolatum TaxID=7740 RepID=A0A8K0EEM6_BRALA|nr:Hypp7524 [Branchiostoma lanceolatum]